MAPDTRPRLASFFRGDRPGYGLITDDGIVDLSARFSHQWQTLRAVVTDGALARLIDKAAGLPADFGANTITFDIPVPDAEKIICVGVNYPDRNAEYKDGQDAPSNPSLFPRFTRSFVGHLTPLTRPLASAQLDYEGEVVIVIGKAGRHIREAGALAHIAALSLCNEGTLAKPFTFGVPPIRQ